ncbi:hypothetical protein FDP41_010463 [Naegleria fowleri]|uniref:Uncharacterized protein n=1 Tax=Naegleria fowleri TaxID=5763 RepID=A0A6A5CCZ0_NAEFO|nr:uncharacterized protein FDP41_010463 [Naegleria fowleri]KAF0983398.1 hypothetical protein FDP41_010463 [Naegleria fowleri]CAG4715396.1 unnamed protein product [Naegleria fowleri]
MFERPIPSSSLASTYSPRRYGVYAVLHPSQPSPPSDLFYEFPIFLQLLDRYIHSEIKSVATDHHHLEYGTQHIWGNLFHVTLVGFTEMPAHDLDDLKKVLSEMENVGTRDHNESEEITLKWRMSHDKEQPLLDFRVMFKNQGFVEIVQKLSEMEFYKIEHHRKRLRLKNDYHASLLSDVKPCKKDEIVNFFSKYRDLLPNIYACLVDDSDGTCQQIISDMFKNLRWCLKIVSYDNVKEPLERWKEHDTFIM